jgi:predicted enzyme related to lactoylglutathione lyase
MTLFVPDLGRAREFYQAAFGLDAQVMDDDTATGAGARQRVPATRLVRRAGISPVSR